MLWKQQSFSCSRVIFTRGILVGPLSFPQGDADLVERLFYQGTLMSLSPQRLPYVYSGTCSYRHFSPNLQYLFLAYIWQDYNNRSSVIREFGMGCNIILPIKFTYVMFVSDFFLIMGFIARTFLGVFKVRVLANLSLVIKGQLRQILLNNCHAWRSFYVWQRKVPDHSQNSVRIFES